MVVFLACGGTQTNYHEKQYIKLSMCIIPQTVLALGVLTVLLRALERSLDPVALPGSRFPCKIQYLVTPTLKNTQ